MKMHKEEKPDEVFVGNTNHHDFEDLLHQGIECRLGNKAYYIDGKEIERNYLKPLFVSKKSLKKYDTYMRKSSGFTVHD